MSGPRPEPFSAYTTPSFWDDPHISGHLLRAHLDPEFPMASRRHEVVDATAAWLASDVGLGPGSRVLDLGCGPGLHAHRLARGGVEVVGLDVSRRSIAHATQVARTERLSATFRVGNYLTDPLGRGFDAALLLFEDYSALSPAQRSRLLARVAESLEDDGAFVVDVTAAPRFEAVEEGSTTGVDLMDGFWAASPYTATHETMTWPDLRVVLDRYTVEDASGRRVFWNWMQCLTRDEVAAELTAAGFPEVEWFGDLTGAPFDATAPSFAAVARRG